MSKGACSANSACSASRSRTLFAAVLMPVTPSVVMAAFAGSREMATTCAVGGELSQQRGGVGLGWGGVGCEYLAGALVAELDAGGQANARGAAEHQRFLALDDHLGSEWKLRGVWV